MVNKADFKCVLIHTHTHGMLNISVADQVDAYKSRVSATEPWRYGGKKWSQRYSAKWIEARENRHAWCKSTPDILRGVYIMDEILAEGSRKIVADGIFEFVRQHYVEANKKYLQKQIAIASEYLTEEQKAELANYIKSVD